MSLWLLVNFVTQNRLKACKNTMQTLNAGPSCGVSLVTHNHLEACKTPCKRWVRGPPAGSILLPRIVSSRVKHNANVECGALLRGQFCYPESSQGVQNTMQTLNAGPSCGVNFVQNRLKACKTQCKRWMRGAPAGSILLPRIVSRRAKHNANVERGALLRGQSCYPESSQGVQNTMQTLIAGPSCGVGFVPHIRLKACKTQCKRWMRSPPAGSVLLPRIASRRAKLCKESA